MLRFVQLPGIARCQVLAAQLLGIEARAAAVAPLVGLRFLRYFHRGLSILPHESVEVFHQGEVLLPMHQHDFPGVAALGLSLIHI